MYKTLSGKEPADALLKKVKVDVEQLDLKPVLGIVVVGDYKPSEIYVNRKRIVASEVGIETEIHRMPETIKQNELLELIDKLNNDTKISGFIVQTPLPKHINTNEIFERISQYKDVDGFNPNNMGKLMLNLVDDNMFSPATPSGVMHLFDFYNVDFQGKNAVVIGRSNTVGKPAAMMLLHRNATVALCHTHTKNLADYTRNAEIIVAAAGSPGLLKSDMIKENAYIADVGTTRIKTNEGKDKVVGDVDFENVINKANCSPVPGGVGPLTVAMLIANTVKAAKMKK